MLLLVRLNKWIKRLMSRPAPSRPYSKAGVISVISPRVCCAEDVCGFYWPLPCSLQDNCNHVLLCDRHPLSLGSDDSVLLLYMFV